MKFIRTALAISALTMSMGVGSALATEAEPSIAQVKGVAERLGNGKPTKADEAFLRKHPKIAAQIPDARRTEIGESSSLRTAAGCHYADRYMIVRSGTGGKLYTYHTVINSWCENGSSISSSTFSDYFSDIAGSAMQNPKTSLIKQLQKPASNHWVAYTGGSIQNCVIKYGCIGTKYPAQKISHYAGRGNTTYQWYNKDDGDGWRHQ